jgi:hypothetical protein
MLRHGGVSIGRLINQVMYDDERQKFIDLIAGSHTESKDFVV